MQYHKLLSAPALRTLLALPAATIAESTESAESAGSATPTLMIAWALLFIGLMRMIAAFQMLGMPGWVWTLIGGIAAIVLGIMIMNRWPVSGLWVIGMFVAIELIFNGWGMIMAALAVRNLASRKQ